LDHVQLLTKNPAYPVKTSIERELGRNAEILPLFCFPVRLGFSGIKMGFPTNESTIGKRVEIKGVEIPECSQGVNTKKKVCRPETGVHLNSTLFYPVDNFNLHPLVAGPQRGCYSPKCPLNL
jgi:hypothetical protein